MTVTEDELIVNLKKKKKGLTFFRKLGCKHGGEQVAFQWCHKGIFKCEFFIFFWSLFTYETNQTFKMLEVILEIQMKCQNLTTGKVFAVCHTRVCRHLSIGIVSGKLDC